MTHNSRNAVLTTLSPSRSDTVPLGGAAALYFS